MNQLVKINSDRLSRRGGYTIFEIAIVMFILGLVIGVVVIGSDMIRSAQLRAVTAERDYFDTAINTFEAKYRQLPGDMPNAFDLWGAGPNSCGTNTIDAGTGCNGDGNGDILPVGGENIKAWEHLRLAEIITGTYDGNGTVYASNTVYPSRQNSPVSKLPTAIWMVGMVCQLWQQIYHKELDISPSAKSLMQPVRLIILVCA